MRRVGRTLRDQKESPMDRALWWVEYVARTEGAPHLRSPALHLRWYQVFMVDVVAVFLIVAVLALAAIYVLGVSLASTAKPTKSHMD